MRPGVDLGWGAMRGGARAQEGSSGTPRGEASWEGRSWTPGGQGARPWEETRGGRTRPWRGTREHGTAGGGGGRAARLTWAGVAQRAVGGGGAQRQSVPRRGRASTAPAPPALRARRSDRRRSRAPAAFPPRPPHASPAPGPAMAQAVWSRLGRILWLACLLPWAPAGVAAGKALGNSASLQPQPARGLEPSQRASGPGSGDCGGGTVRPARISLLG